MTSCLLGVAVMHMRAHDILSVGGVAVMHIRAHDVLSIGGFAVMDIRAHDVLSVGGVAVMHIRAHDVLCVWRVQPPVRLSCQFVTLERVSASVALFSFSDTVALYSASRQLKEPHVVNVM
jgi:hypothetical protein